MAIWLLPCPLTVLLKQRQSKRGGNYKGNLPNKSEALADKEVCHRGSWAILIPKP